ncbi:MAG: hypothetical protein D6820_17610, partial [Lentisphaerae bacterium]
MSRTCGLISLLLLFGLSFVTVTQEPKAQVEKKGGSINYNGSRRIPSYSWARVDYSLKNNLEKKVRARIRTTPINQRNLTIYDADWQLPALRKVIFGHLITVGAVNTYAVDLFVEGQQLTDANARVNNIRLSHPTDHYLLFLNDDPDVGYGNFARNDSLGKHYVTVMCSADKAPRHWAGFDYTAGVFVFRPNFERYSWRQFEALRQYVAHGGTLVFIDPQGVVAATKTPLRDLVPVTPVMLHRVDRLTCLKTLGGRELLWKKDGGFFLEALAGKDAFVSLKEGEYPVACWRKVGLGIVGATMFSPSDDLLRSGEFSDEFNLFWRHILHFADRDTFITSSRDIYLARAIDKLTGIKIPSAAQIKKMVGVYLLLIVGIVIAGVLLRRHITAWLVLSCVATGMIVYIFVLAS